MLIKSRKTLLAKRLPTTVTWSLVSLERNLYGLRKVTPISHQSVCSRNDHTEVIVIMSWWTWAVNLRFKSTRQGMLDGWCTESPEQNVGHRNIISWQRITSPYMQQPKCPWWQRKRGCLKNRHVSAFPHQSDDQLAMCSVSVIYSYEATAIIGPSKENNFPPTGTREGSPVAEKSRPLLRRHRCPQSMRGVAVPQRHLCCFIVCERHVEHTQPVEAQMHGKRGWEEWNFIIARPVGSRWAKCGMPSSLEGWWIIQYLSHS